MTKVNSFLAQRFKKATQKLSKMTHLVELSSSGQLSSFTGVFRVSSLSTKEQQMLQRLLEEFKNEAQETYEDLKSLSEITAEVKAINSQAILLHGERIKKAQTILKNYRDGAFSAWMIAAYGNRQTPYNFLQYYELYLALPQTLHDKLDTMPKQAVYSLASREAPFVQKQEIIENYESQSKQELLEIIRTAFPLAKQDKRATDHAQMSIASLRRLHRYMRSPSFFATAEQKKELRDLLEELRLIVDE